MITSMPTTGRTHPLRALLRFLLLSPSRFYSASRSGDRSDGVLDTAPWVNDDPSVRAAAEAAAARDLASTGAQANAFELRVTSQSRYQLNDI
jgi:hypothetical protein